MIPLEILIWLDHILLLCVFLCHKQKIRRDGKPITAHPLIKFY